MPPLCEFVHIYIEKKNWKMKQRRIILPYFLFYYYTTFISNKKFMRLLFMIKYCLDIGNILWVVKEFREKKDMCVQRYNVQRKMRTTRENVLTLYREPRNENDFQTFIVASLGTHQK